MLVFIVSLETARVRERLTANRPDKNQSLFSARILLKGNKQFHEAVQDLS